MMHEVVVVKAELVVIIVVFKRSNDLVKVAHGKRESGQTFLCEYDMSPLGVRRVHELHTQRRHHLFQASSGVLGVGVHIHCQASGHLKAVPSFRHMSNTCGSSSKNMYVSS